jgi:hypothetical protein
VELAREHQARHSVDPELFFGDRNHGPSFGPAWAAPPTCSSKLVQKLCTVNAIAPLRYYKLM